MPIYEYKCVECGHQLEAIQKVSDDPLTECPTCGPGKLKRLISPAGFQLKGSGWYATDFKNSGKKKDDKKDGTASPSESTDAAPEKKAHTCGGGCTH